MMRKRTTFLSLLLAFVSVQGAYEDPVLSPETEVVVVECELQGKGAFDILVVPSWAPLGAERFLQLVDIGFFDGLGLFRAVENFLVQVKLEPLYDRYSLSVCNLALYCSSAFPLVKSSTKNGEIKR